MSGWFNYSANNRPNRRGRGLPHQLARSGGFVSVDLNLVGWIVMLLPGVIIGVIVSVVADLPLLPAIVVGALSAWIVAVTADRVKDRYRLIGVQYDWLSAEGVEIALQRVRSLGIKVTHERIEVDKWRYGHLHVSERPSHVSVFHVQKRHYQAVDDIVVAQASPPDPPEADVD